MRAMKLSISIVWRGVWINPFLYFRVWLRQSNIMVDLINNYPRQKMKIPPEGKTRNRWWLNTSRDVKELKSRPYP